MSKNNWTDQLPELFEGYTEEEPEGLWDAVQGAMAPKQKKAVAAWWWYGAAALAAAACIAVGVFLFHDDSPILPSDATVIPGDNLAVISSEDTFVIPSEVEESVVDVPDNEEHTVIPSEVEGSPKSNDIDSSCPATTGHLEAGKEEKGEESLIIEMTGEVTEKGEEGINEEEQVVIKKEDTKEDKKEVVKETEVDDVWNDIINGKEEGIGKNHSKTRKPTEVKLKVGVASGQYLAQDVTRTTTGYGIPVAYPGMPMSKASGSTTGLNPIMLSRNKPSITDAQHHQSSRWGVTLQANVNKHWGAETGIFLTTLKSSYATESGTALSTTEREMHYIGFPLHIQYRFWTLRSFSLYGFTGPMFETSYRTRVTTVQTIGGVRNYETDRTRIKDNRWSLQAGAGAQLQLFSGMHVFVQPSLSWHIPNGSDLENAYSEHPLAPEMFFGVRFSF